MNKADNDKHNKKNNTDEAVEKQETTDCFQSLRENTSVTLGLYPGFENSRGFLSADIRQME